MAKEVADLKKKLKKSKDNEEKAEARAKAADERLATHKAKEAADTKVTYWSSCGVLTRLVDSGRYDCTD